jgi:CBS domain containing-hemolysin-like protein
MVLFIVAVAIVFIATGTCALIEASLYAVRRPFIHRLVEAGHPAGRRLVSFKEKMDYPITAILIFDTLLGVGGSAIAGSQARALYGETFVYWFTLVLAATLLIFAQIVPKILGVVYNQSIAKHAAASITASIYLLYPIVRSIEFFTRHLKPEEPPKRAVEEDVKQMARISVQEGSILSIEADLIQNSLKLNDVRADQIMTPFAEVISLPANIRTRDAFQGYHQSSLSRIPIYEPNHPERWTKLVFSRDILFAMANDRFELTLQDIAHPMHFVPGKMPGHLLLDAFLKRRSHLFGVQDPEGKDIGVVSLEDVMEEILGTEIVDEKEAGRES